MDLSERSRGALVFAQWLSERSSASERLIGVHVVDASTADRDYPGHGPPLDRARETLRASIEAQHMTSAYERLEVIPGDDPETQLERAVETHEGTGLIVGRSAPIEGWSLISLGRVTRRLLRSMHRPTVVVPPDLEASSLGRGPILVGIVPQDHARAAVTLGRELARDLDLPLSLLYVRPQPGMMSPMAAGDPSMAYAIAIAEQAQLGTEEPPMLREWAEREGFADLPRNVEVGRPGPSLRRIAQTVDASMIICGSRGLSLRDRIFLSSTGSELAAHAERPVMLVPGD